jgi:hypothetical protein
MNNVAPFEKPVPETKTARFTISAEVEGFPVSIEVEGKAEALKAMIERLKTIGAEPPAKASTPAAASNRSDVPRCNLHNKPMRPSKKPGSFFCPARLGDDSYCDQKVEG